MTDEYKKQLIDYTTGLLNNENPDPKDFWILDVDFKQFKDSFNDFFDELDNNASALKITGILENEKYDVSILYGAYFSTDTTSSQRGRGFLIYLDKNNNVLDVLFRDKHNNYLRGFHKLYFDESSNRVYGVCGHPTVSPQGNTEPNYFCYIKNLFNKNNEDKYEFDINTSYNLNETNIHVREIVKNPESATYLMVGTDARTEENIRVIQYTINVGESDVIKKWNVINYGVYGGYYWTTVNMLAYYLWFNGDTPHFKIIFGGLNYNTSQTTYNGKYYGLATDNGDNVSYTRLSQIQDIVSPYTGNSWKKSEQLEVLGINQNEIYFVVVYQNPQLEGDDIVSYYETRLHKFNGSAISTLLVSPSSSATSEQGKYHDCEYYNFYKDTDGTIYLIKTKYVNNQTIVYTYAANFTKHYNILNDGTIWEYLNSNEYTGGDRIYSNFSIMQRNYNISKVFEIVGDVSNIKFTQANLTGYILIYTNLYNLDGYNGVRYIDKDFFVPKLVDLYSNNKLVFSRNLYNVSIQNNRTMSSVEVPSTYLNTETIDINDLIGKTRYTLNRDTTNWNKNIYENVDISFLNTITVKDEDTDTIYELPAIKLNNAITNGGDLNYTNTPCLKYRINYSDDTTKVEEINWNAINNYNKETQFTFYCDKNIKNIELISYDETTTYLRIVNNFDLYNYYTVNQKIRIEN